MTAKRTLLDSPRDNRDVITLRKMADMMRDYWRAAPTFFGRLSRRGRPRLRSVAGLSLLRTNEENNE